MITILTRDKFLKRERLNSFTETSMGESEFNEIEASLFNEIEASLLSSCRCQTTIFHGQKYKRKFLFFSKTLSITLLFTVLLSTVREFSIYTSEPLITLKSLSFPLKEDPWTQNDIPVVMDFTGTGTDSISAVLSECLNLIDFRNSKDFQGAGFMLTDSLCQISRNFDRSKRARIFLVLRNPEFRTKLLFAMKKDVSNPLYDERVSNLDFLHYVNSTLFEKNVLTKSILCKTGEITDEDYETAKKIVKDNISVARFPQRSIFMQVQENYGLLHSRIVQNCMNHKFGIGMKNIAKYQYIFKEIPRRHPLLKEINEYDMKLFSYMFSKKGVH